MMHKLLNQMRMSAQIALSNLKTSRMGIISNYDPATYKVQVVVQPQNNDSPDKTNTGWLPLFSPWVGNGWGFFAPPAIGAVCAIHYSEGSHTGAFVTLCTFNQVMKPVAVDAGEMWLLHETGSYIKLQNNGEVEISGKVKVNLGNIDEGNLKKLLTEAAAEVFNGHTHASNGAPPSQQMDASSMTQYTGAN